MPFADAIELRTHISNILSAQLGEWEDGSPRIHIKPPQPTLSGKAKTDTTNQSELECIIQRMPEGEPQIMSAGQRFKEAVYLVSLVNFADDTNLTQAMATLEVDSLMSYARPRVYLPSDSRVDLPEQVRFYPVVNQVLNSVVYSD